MKDVYPNFDSYAPWVKKLLVLKLFAPGGSQGSWMDHHLLVHRERRGQMLGSLDREVITEMRTKWLEMALPYLENPAVSDSERTKLAKDLDAVKWAGICLDRLVDHDAASTFATPNEVAKDVQDNPFGEPMEGTPASGENDETKRGATLEPPVDQTNLEMQFAQLKEKVIQTPEFSIGEGQSQPEPALPPVAPLATRAQDSSEAEELSTSNGREPVSIGQAVQLLVRLEEKALAETTSWQELKKGMVASGRLVDLIREDLGKAEASRELVEYSLDVWLTYLDRVGTMLEEARQKKLIADVGRRRDEEKPTLEGMGVTKRLGNYIRQLRTVGLDKAKTELRQLDRLTKTGLFNHLASPNKKGSGRTHKNKAEDLDPRRFFLAFISDMRANPTYYSQVGAAKLLDDPRILENLDPIEEHYVNFSIAIIGALRARRAVAMEKLKAEVSN